ncbi:MAG: GyrI-like domain-containing protein [Eubacteriales bacterium]|nr:GyrI-like domain-containing protein [Eubacteriales bacterium]
MTIEIRTIPACVAYSAEYNLPGIGSFFNTETGENILYDLQHEMEADNPEVHVPDLGDDYNFFEYPPADNGDGTVHIRYFDMVDVKGKDSKTGAYRFCDVPEIKAATMMHQGYYDTLDAGFAKLYDWIEAKGYECCGKARISAINGSWNTENPDECVNELQVPVRKK